MLVRSEARGLRQRHPGSTLAPACVAMGERSQRSSPRVDAPIFGLPPRDAASKFTGAAALVPRLGRDRCRDPCRSRGRGDAAGGRACSFWGPDAGSPGHPSRGHRGRDPRPVVVVVTVVALMPWAPSFASPDRPCAARIAVRRAVIVAVTVPMPATVAAAVDAPPSPPGRSERGSRA